MGLLLVIPQLGFGTPADHVEAIALRFAVMLIVV
jgi:hypothetical protein